MDTLTAHIEPRRNIRHGVTRKVVKALSQAVLRDFDKPLAVREGASCHSGNLSTIAIACTTPKSVLRGGPGRPRSCYAVTGSCPAAAADTLTGG